MCMLSGVTTHVHVDIVKHQKGLPLSAIMMLASWQAATQSC